jgi:hypothetical protein
MVGTTTIAIAIAIGIEIEIEIQIEIEIDPDPDSDLDFVHLTKKCPNPRGGQCRGTAHPGTHRAS